VKRLIPFLAVLVAGFVFFSFLSRTGDMGNRTVIFYEQEKRDCSVIAKELENRLKEDGRSVSLHGFDPTQINYYVLSNPGSCYITEMPVSSPLFYLQEKKALIAKVFVTVLTNTQNSGISGKTFDTTLKKQRLSDAEVLRRISKGRMNSGIISFQNLDFSIRPVAVDGVFPDLDSIRQGRYEKIYRAYVYKDMNKTPSNADPVDTIDNAWIQKAFSLIAGGDIMLSRGTAKYIAKYGPDYPFEGIQDEIRKYDIAFANLESVISSGGRRFSPNKGIYFRADPAVVNGLVFSGFDVFSLGNNHAFDWGVDAVRDTMRLLRENGLKYTGVGSTEEEAFKPAVMNVRGTTVAFISFNDVYPFMVHESRPDAMQTLSLNDTLLQQKIENLQSRYDILVASVHAGAEYINEPEPEKVRKMRQLIDYGTDIVLGTHPHVIQGIEIYNGGLIAYSLGNCVFDQSWSDETGTGMLLEISFIGDKPLYYRPRIIVIDHTQARLLNLITAKPLISSLYVGSQKDEYIKN